jgi:hypothetical protein
MKDVAGVAIKTVSHAINGLVTRGPGEIRPAPAMAGGG